MIPALYRLFTIEDSFINKPDFRYVRIRGKELVRKPCMQSSFFSMCWQMIQKDIMEENADLFREIDSWFSENRP